ncbi:MAG: hypothetical protein ACTHLU_06515 [Novosphingobium sp.]
MSRIGKVPVAIPADVTAEIANGVLSVKGPKGTLTLSLRDEITYTVEDGASWCARPTTARRLARSGACSARS